MNIDKLTKWVEQVKNAILVKLAYSYLGSAMMNRFSLYVKLGDEGSYTNNSDIIMVSVTNKEAIHMSLKDLLRVLKFLLYHECSHVLYTDDEKYRECATSGVEILGKEAAGKNINLNQQMAFFYMSELMNCIEDGRIENILCNKKPGLKKHRDWYRIKNWNEDQGEPYQDVLIAYLDALNIIATMGIYPKDFENRASTTVVNNMKKCEPLIGSFVASNTLSEGKQYVEQIIKIIAPDIVDRFDSKLTEEEKRMLVEALRKLMEQNNSNASNYKANETGNEQPNGPIIAILTDNAKEEGDNTGKKPDYIIDLRTKKDQSKGSQKQPESDGDSSSNDHEGKSEQEQTPEDGQSGKESNQTEKDSGNDMGSKPDKGSNNGQNDESGINSPEMGEKPGESDTDASKTKQGKDGNEDNGTKYQKADNNSGDNPLQLNKMEDSSPEDQMDGESESSSGTMVGDNSQMSSQRKDQNESNLNESMQSKIDTGSEKKSEQIQESIEEILSDKMEGIESETDREISKDLEQARKGIELSNKNEENGKYSLTADDINSVNKDLFQSNFHENARSKTYKRKVATSEPIKIRASRTCQKIKNIIKAKETEERVELFSGSLDVNALGLFCTGKPNVFKEGGIPSDLETCCYILKDNSGSMDSSFKENLAIEALSEVESTLKDVMPLKEVAFYATGNSVYHDVIKEWDDNDASISYAESYRASGNYPRECNNDAYSIYCAALELIKRPEENKILIVISDGLPSGCNEADVQKAVRFARKNRIFVINFLIGDKRTIENLWERFKNMYETYFCGVNPEKLGNSLFSFLKKYVESL
jgi:hypothetical protein